MYQFKTNIDCTTHSIIADFNTSHVSVQALSTAFVSLRIAYFNTSHVSVQAIIAVNSITCSYISIHLMYQFKLFIACSVMFIFAFQYISCISSSKRLGHKVKFKAPFQYISCISSSFSILGRHRVQS